MVSCSSTAFFFIGRLTVRCNWICIRQHVYQGKWRWGVLLALPEMLAILYFFFSTSEAVADSSAGFRNVVSFLIIPFGASIGIWLKNKNGYKAK